MARPKPGWRSGVPITMCRCMSLTGERNTTVAGLARDAIYLLRPDTYVALADASGAPDALDRDHAARWDLPYHEFRDRR